MRIEAHQNYLQTLPYWTLYHRYNGAPPLLPAQLQLFHSQVNQANVTLQQGVDQDWRTSCMRYPEVLDYYFSLVEVSLPSDRDPSILDPRFGGGRDLGPRRMKDKKPAPPLPPDLRDLQVKEHRKKERRMSGGPPRAPMPRDFR